jgi:hypothetical protein
LELHTERNQESGVPLDEIRETGIEGEAPSLASVWKCPNCGTQVQIVVAPSVEPTQPFTCVCGTPMVAGEEH